ncbi:MAG: methionyl aminopeptidase [Verrucomicrobiales bacterium]|jgi:methionyl aminopeptidase
MTREKINIRSGKQIDMMRSAGETASEILQKVAASVQPGVTTKEVDDYARELIAERGCKSAFLGYRNFPGHICISVNEEVVHGIGGPRKVKYGDILKIDVGIVKDGWVGDNALTVPVGSVSPEVQRLLLATEESLHVAISHAVDGGMLGDLCHSIEDCVVKRGYTVVREFVGHGVGRKLHEPPQVPNYGKKGDRPRLREGMILAIEPMVNEGTARVKVLSDKWTVVTMDRKPSAHFEHTVLVRKGEAEILTPRPRLTF